MDHRLICKTDNKTFRKKNSRKSLGFRERQRFLELTLKILTIKLISDKLGLIKIKSFCFVKDSM